MRYLVTLPLNYKFFHRVRFGFKSAPLQAGRLFYFKFYSKTIFNQKFAFLTRNLIEFEHRMLENIFFVLFGVTNKTLTV